MTRVKDSNPFGPGLLKFLRELDRNNDRAWFEANKQRYEDEVREPGLAFIRIMAGHVHKISPHLIASDKRVGGSMMRIYRDVRFSKNKAPYKTNLGIQFRHDAGKDVHAPGLYFHVEPKQCFLGCGMWHPDPKSLGAVREAIDEDPKGWKRVRDGKRFRGTWELGGESLKRPPRGYSEDHRFIEDLKRKDHIAFCSLADREIHGPELIADVVDRFRRSSAYLRWLAETLQLDF
jgi:uncharacterized protein (TIGR02453 family)